MNSQHTGYIIGAYPCAPSFHYKNENDEASFWRKLADSTDIRGLEQPCLEELHPFGDNWLLNHIPGDWEIVVTAIMGTMQQRASQPGFGLASADETQRQACLNWYRHLYQKINRINDSAAKKRVIALEIHAAPLATASVEHSTAAFNASLDELTRWDWSCDLVLEHCDAMNGVQPGKGFLPLENVLDTVRGRNIRVALNWARSVIERRDTEEPLRHLQQVLNQHKLAGLMFSGTTESGPYGEWGDLHAPFAPFPGSEAGCHESLMTVEQARKWLHAVPGNSLSFLGIKLLEINASADVSHRVAILHDGIRALNLAKT